MLPGNSFGVHSVDCQTGANLQDFSSHAEWDGCGQWDWGDRSIDRREPSVLASACFCAVFDAKRIPPQGWTAGAEAAHVGVVVERRRSVHSLPKQQFFLQRSLLGTHDDGDRAGDGLI
jgi:hypothetical protein